MPSNTGRKFCWPRGLVAAIILLVALAFHIASVTTPLIVWKRFIYRPHPVVPNVTLEIYNEVRLGLMNTRVILDTTGTDQGDDNYVVDTKELPNGCEKLHRMTDAMRTFFFTSLGMCGCCVIVAILNMLGLVPSLGLSLLVFGTAGFGALGVQLAFLIWETEMCEGLEVWKNRDGAKIWTSVPFLIVALGLENIAMALTCCLPKGPHDEVLCFKSKQSPAAPPANEPIYSPTAEGAPIGA